MKPGLVRLLLVLLAMLASGAARADLTNCSISAAPFTVTYVDTAATANQTPVTFTVTCNRGGNPKNNTVRLSLSQSATETMPNTTSIYADTLRYNWYTDAGYSRLWSTGPVSGTGPGSIDVAMNYTANNTSASNTFTAYLSFPASQTGKAAGTYSGSLGVSFIDTTPNPGVPLNSGSVTASATIAKNCNFAPTLPSWSLNYTAFQPGTITDASQNVGLTCTRGTSYTLQLDATAGVIPNVELQYTLVFSTNSTGTVTGTPSSSTTLNNYGLTLTVPGGQSGACVTLPCSGTAVRTLTVTY